MVDLIDVVLGGTPVRQIHSPDFINLPKKNPHGLVANGHPVTRLSTLWKIIAAVLEDNYQPKLVHRGVLPPHQFWMHPSCSSVELLRVLHDVWWDQWRQQSEAWVLSDDVRHAYGSLSHRTEHMVLVSAGLKDTDARVPQRHDQDLHIHMGGADGKAPSATHLGAGTGQGCPISGMK